ncbi:MAG: sigma-70 family RNA polymerase sigma factor [Prevotella sp.]|nr:sigma-70 family RNA polymerase sigma factor [Prevotella sp.]
MSDTRQLISYYYCLHRDEIVDFVALRIKDEDEAKDIVQDLFLRLINGHQLTTIQTLPGLVYTMARHLIADYYRHRHTYEAYEYYVRRSDHTDETVESVFSARQIMERLERSLAYLPEDCRKAYRLHIYDGMRVSEISKELGEDYKRIENRLGLARKVVRHQLKACV